MYFEKNIYLNDELIITLTIPSDITEVQSYAFYNCESLKCVSIPNSVTSVGDSAFRGCSSLTSVIIPDSVSSIGKKAFYNCSSLTSVYCKPTTPPAGGSDMFYNGDSTLKIYVPRNSVDAYKAKSYWSNYASYIVGYDFE